MYTLRTIGNRGVLFGTDAIPDCITYSYLIKGKKSNYLIDTGLGSGTAEYIKDYIALNCPGEVIVINTHYHWDHIWGNIGFEGNAIYAHTLAPEMIRRNWNEMEQKGGKWKEGRIKNVLPDRLIANHFNFDEDGIEIFYTPGHTIDSLSVYDHLDKVLHVGDNVETPFPSIHDTEEHLVDSLRKYLEYDFTRCISGHNGDVKREDILAVIEAYK